MTLRGNLKLLPTPGYHRVSSSAQLAGVELTDGQLLPVSQANEARFRWNVATGKLEMSLSGAAYVEMAAGGVAGLVTSLLSGSMNAFGTDPDTHIVFDGVTPGGVPTSVFAIEQPLSVFRPEDPAFGAVGDGVTDDTAAIQAALAAAGSAIVGPAARAGAVVQLSHAAYAFTTIDIPSGVTLRGMGRSATLLHSTQLATNGGAVRLAFDANTQCRLAAIEDLAIYADEGHCIFADPDQAAFDIVKHFDGAAYTDRTAVSLEPFGTAWDSHADANDRVYCGQTAAPTPAAMGTLRGLLANRPKNCTWVLEYWNGAGWAAIGATDLSNGTRHRHWYWSNPADWASTVVDGDAAYWVRLSTSTVPTATVQAHGFYQFAGNILNCRFTNLRLSGGKEAIYLDRAYTQACKFDDIYVALVGGGCLSIVGNANVINGIDEEGGARSIVGGDAQDFREALAQIIVAGAGNSVSQCTVEGITTGPASFYCSGHSLDFRSNWFEGGRTVTGGAWAIFEGIAGGRVDCLQGNTFGGAVIGESFWDCVIDIGSVGSGDQLHYLPEYLMLDADDATSSIHVGVAHGNFIASMGDDERVTIGRFASSDGVTRKISHAANTPATGNLIRNGSFEFADYGWSVVDEAGVASTVTVENAPDGRGKRLKVVFAGGGAGALCCTITQSIEIPAHYANARGQFAYRSARTGTEQVMPHVNNVDAGGRAQDTWCSTSVADIGAGPVLVGWWLYGDAAGGGTIYIEDANLVLGNGTMARAAAVWPIGASVSIPRAIDHTVVPNVALSTDAVVLADSNGGDVDYELPAAADSDGRWILVGDWGQFAGTNRIRVLANVAAADTINGAAYVDLTVDGTAAQCLCYGGVWQTLAV